ncbi:3-oxo-tetronate kinase [Aquibaculum arenosum]|uniref:3-oxo-tetronate kinase n=1 Tax=Aquibaculum arenosum TaxID=3032591 RepID=A0ABT5YLM5_9PROT|nr:3-oxo-tetronate kinase [Fodinicurvata sp. CAU 1616]MDF2095867.1 four-carbon acid sugar kinase family protein [Fodinicurvata sp. CAU 1616]
MLLGCIADDVTGASDLASTLVREGMRTVQVLGVPASDWTPPDVDAVVVALKSRTAPVAEAVRQSLEALEWLRGAGARQIFFKYCSTFDSTDAGNIGPVAEALLEALGGEQTIYCPAFPTNGRSIYQGHLFVGDRLLSESGMENHPLTPMTDADLVRVLGRQTRHPVGLVPYASVSGGAEAIRTALDELRAEGKRHAIVDALDDAHLRAIGKAVADLSLVTGGSGVALGLPENFRRSGLLQAEVSDALPEIAGAAAVLSGSCSRATNAQVAHFAAKRPALRLDPLALARGAQSVETILDWARPKMGAEPILIYATAEPDAVAAVQSELGREAAGTLVEETLAGVAKGLVAAGLRRLVVAGGETSGAVVAALGIAALRIGPEIDPGVPWTATLGEPPLLLALKSGNFGTVDFFEKAFRQLPGGGA